MDKIAENIKRIKAHVALYNASIVAVTKYFDETQIIKYYDLGLRDFGENRAVEAVKKINSLPEYIKKNSRFHFIGHLQTNKVRLVVGNFELIHSVDSLELAQKINEESQSQGLVQKILLQVNNAKEPQKFGFYPEEITEAFSKIIKMKFLDVKGLMNIAPLNKTDEELHDLFKNIKQIYDDLQNKFELKLEQISMGMSNDFLIALEEGSTMIRLGKVLFE